jgi:hypothetical protein
VTCFTFGKTSAGAIDTLACCRPQGALIAERFIGPAVLPRRVARRPARIHHRGGQAPRIATWLFGTFHSAFAIAIHIAICAVGATALMTGLHRQGHLRAISILMISGLHAPRVCDDRRAQILQT